MTIEQLLLDLMKEVQSRKAGAAARDTAQYYAILNIDIQKVYAFYLTYLYSQEAEESQL